MDDKMMKQAEELANRSAAVKADMDQFTQLLASEFAEMEAHSADVLDALCASMELQLQPFAAVTSNDTIDILRASLNQTQWAARNARMAAERLARVTTIDLVPDRPVTEQV
jgi:hypothetical protein